MIHFLFWNLNNKELSQSVASLAKRHNIDVIILAESGTQHTTMLKALDNSTGAQFTIPDTRCEKIFIYSRLSRTFFTAITESPRITIQKLLLPLKPEILLAAIHLPSRLYFTPGSLATEAHLFMQDLLEAEARVGHRRTLVVGDFNMNPFEDGMVGSGAFNAVMTRQIAMRGHRTVQGRQHVFFYNPMWSLFGDGRPDPPGTYYYERNEHICFFWNIFDQVLLRPDLLGHFNNENLQILTSDGTVSFVSESGRPDSSRFSDHLPLLFTVGL